jgi:hypothetical protein
MHFARTMARKLVIAACLSGFLATVLPFSIPRAIEARRAYGENTQEEPVRDFVREDSKWFGKNEMLLANLGTYIETTPGLSGTLSLAQQSRKDLYVWGGATAVSSIAIGGSVAFLSLRNLRNYSNKPKTKA